MRRFTDRRTAGRELAIALRRLELPPDPLVLGLPRGGVPVAAEVASALHAPLDVMPVRKLGAPADPELAIGAIAPGDILIRDPDSGQQMSEQAFRSLVRKEKAELARRERTYREGRAPLQLRGRTVILVDDGIATGDTMLAAIRAARAGGATYVLATAPVASSEASDRIRHEADRVVVLNLPEPLFGVGEWYEKFEQLEDSDVTALL